MNLISNFLKRTLKKIYLNILYRLPNKSYSQEGEDLILKRFFENRKAGFYIDIGAFHPIRFSNTYLFYKMGWKGINIEARPGSKVLFDKNRKRDINIEAAINDEVKELTYYKFNEPGLNGFSKEISMERNKLDEYKIIDEIKITTSTLTEAFKKHLPHEPKIDFMSIDVEGFDLNVLKSNDWKNYRPEFVLVEDLNFDLMSPTKSDVFNYLIDKNYKLVAKSYNTLFFRDKV
ncbi:MAG: hypothetical protein A2057_11670 [Ignavibacteria bacterium GWA2_35_9]|nr:MAG: hypothetical protein A2057_11670 [Ignavibacteria bacterium GWA2_35_9]OGU46745.1 MAG: hypothetical protein A2000_09035 [Ignavibacteria bacterium GWB2_36_8]OGU50649.1 MAG: hypothetical protein A2080_15125 [Ignavibacteria bacterium GWC2_36_12]